jgi:hypothetical protein
LFAVAGLPAGLVPDAAGAGAAAVLVLTALSTLVCVILFILVLVPVPVCVALSILLGVLFIIISFLMSMYAIGWIAENIVNIYYIIKFFKKQEYFEKN